MGTRINAISMHAVRTVVIVMAIVALLFGVVTMTSNTATSQPVGQSSSQEASLGSPEIDTVAGFSFINRYCGSRLYNGQAQFHFAGNGWYPSKVSMRGIAVGRTYQVKIEQGYIVSAYLQSLPAVNYSC